VVGDDFGDELERLRRCGHRSHLAASLNFGGAERARAAVLCHAGQKKPSFFGL
jgi:hypothetical protein